MRAGIDYALKATPNRSTVRGWEGRTLIQCLCDAKYGLTYQKCRFCHRGWPELSHLLKYAVRHYVCNDCYRYFSAMPRLSLRSK